MMLWGLGGTCVQGLWSYSWTSPVTGWGVAGQGDRAFPHPCTAGLFTFGEPGDPPIPLGISVNSGIYVGGYRSL